jgi:ketosteroid isomerase-like protein
MGDLADSYVEILNTVHRYPELIDAGDFAAVGRYFGDATLAFELGDGSVAELVGAAAIQASFEQTTRRYEDDGTPHTRHVITNPIVEIDHDAGRATCRYYVTVLQRANDFPLQPVWANRYEDRYHRQDGRWTLVHRRGFGHLPGDVSHHLLMSPDV